MTSQKGKRIGFVSTRLAGTDGVTLETHKWEYIYKKPIVMSSYEIYNIDIEPKGFTVVTFGDFIDSETVYKSRELLLNPGMVEEICKFNYQIARKYYSYTILERKLQALLDEALGFDV